HVPRILASEYFKNNQVRTAKGAPQTPEEIVNRVRAARGRQSERKKQTGVLTNAELGEEHRASVLKLGQAEEKLLSQAAETLPLSARGMNRVLKVARTIADLEEQDAICVSHISEALQFRKPPK
ncbi:MAG: hypothetical protein KC925_03340, partial [Candidatus Doudnabacteria bacterium]|nr:hypothetical protein [Candidatus Doudnabacteria bacterium]